MREANELLVDDLKLVMRDAENLIRATTGQTGERLQEARQRLADRLEVARVSADRLQDRARLAAQATGRVIREHPYESIATVVGAAALLLGVLLIRQWTRSE